MPPYMPTFDAIEDRIRHYWDRRAASFTELREVELGSDLHERWLNEIRPHIASAPLRILDVGTGSGFFPALLRPLGYHVTGIDLSPQMIDEARALCARHGINATFAVGDAANTPFAPASFDVILTRNLTWTLPDVEAAYAHWRDLLVPGGKLLNFDAHYGPISMLALTQSLREEGVQNAHRDCDDADLQECDAIKVALSVSRENRPDWDVALLTRLGFSSVTLDRTLSERLYLTQDETFNPVKMFSIVATKP